jgi:predicted anti-sigma-YlaC factor YlaD
MDCRNIKDLLSSFIESELSESERAAVEEHLHACDGCRKEKELLEKTWAMLDGYKAPALSRNFSVNLMAKIREQRGARPNLAFVLAPVMASVCVIIAVYLFVQNRPPIEQPAEEVVSLTSKVDVIEVAPVAQKIERKEEVKLTATDEEIIRNLDVYENIELFQNYALVDDLDVVENLGVKAL